MSPKQIPVDRSDIFPLLAVEAVFTILGAISGYITYMLYLILTFDSTSYSSYVDLLTDILSAAPLEAVFIGGITFAVAVPILEHLLDDNQTDGFESFLLFLGAATFTGFIGVVVAVVLHIARNITSVDISTPLKFMVSLVLVIASELTGATLDMIFVGFISPLFFSITVIIIVAVYSITERLRSLQA